MERKLRETLLAIFSRFLTMQFIYARLFSNEFTLSQLDDIFKQMLQICELVHLQFKTIFKDTNQSVQWN